MTTITVAPLGNYPAGTTNINEFAIADAIQQLKISIARCTTADPTIWPSNSVGLTISLDLWDGSQWIPNLFFLNDVGGIRAKNGVEYTSSYLLTDFISGGYMVPGRKLRGSITITGGVLRSSLTVDVT